jgi:hypothetical protein
MEDELENVGIDLPDRILLDVSMLKARLSES